MSLPKTETGADEKFYADQLADWEHTKKFAEDIQGKARASLTTSGVLVGFSIAVLAALIGSKETSEALLRALQALHHWKLGWCVPAIFLPYFVILAERLKSYSDNKTRGFGKILLSFSLLASLFWFLVAPWLPCGPPTVSFPLAGLVLIVFSAFFLIVSIEFYDSASGWRGGFNDKEGLDKNRENTIWRLHMASIASHSALIGVPFALIGASLLLCFVEFWLGCTITFVALFVVVAKTEMERRLWHMRHP